MEARFIGTFNRQVFAETFAKLLAERDGMTVVPGSVRVYYPKEGESI